MLQNVFGNKFSYLRVIIAIIFATLAASLSNKALACNATCTAGQVSIYNQEKDCNTCARACSTNDGCNPGQICVGSSSTTVADGGCISNDVASGICKFNKMLRSRFGRALATIMVISLAAGFFLGKISWGLMITVALGISALFGAPQIFTLLNGVREVDSSELCGD